MNPTPQQQPNRIETVVRLTDVFDHLKRHKLRVERFEWGEEGLPVVYCEHWESKDD